MLDAGVKVPNIARKLDRTAQAIYARLQRIYGQLRPLAPPHRSVRVYSDMVLGSVAGLGSRAEGDRGANCKTTDV
jgi:hypothetical protein